MSSRPCSIRRRLCVLALLSALASGAHAANFNVVLGGSRLEYSPQTLQIRPGDTVTFRNLGGFHNVVADDGAFRCAVGCDGDGTGGSGNASAQIWAVRVAFPSAGTFGYFCEPHGSPGEGMFGTIVVAAPQQQLPPPTPVPSGGVWFAVALGTLLVVSAAAWVKRRVS